VRKARKIGTIAAGIALLAGAAVAAPTAAYADFGCNPGNFCVFSDDCRNTYQWVGNAASWNGCVTNLEDWVGNAGNAGSFSAVDIFYGSNNSGAYACLPRGYSWNLRDNQEWFTWVAHGDSAGHNQVVHDNAASHRWVNACGNNNF
jgi:hypothetical protein